MPRLPWRLLSVHHRSNRIHRTRGAGASCSGSADTSGSRLLERSCACFSRASFFSTYGALGRPLLISKLNVELCLGQLAANCAQRVPTAFGGCGYAVARPGVQIGTACLAQTFAVFPAQDKSR